jgi:exonuclease SbcC
LLKELEKCSKALGETVTVDSIEEALERKKTEYHEFTQGLNACFTENTGAISILGQRLKEIDSNLSKFSSGVDVKNCPTCETELTPERLKELTRKYSNERIAVEAKKGKLQYALNEVNDKLVQAQKNTKRIDALDFERIRALSTDWEEAKHRVILQKEAIKEAEKQAEILQSLDKEIEQLESEKRSLEDAHKEYEASQRQLAKLPSQEKIDSQMKPITVAIAAATRLIEDSLTKVGYTPIDPQKELKELRKKKETYDQKLPIAEKKAELESSLQKTSTDLSVCKEQLSSVVNAIEDLGYDEEKHEEQERLLDAKLNAKSDLEKEIAGLKQARINAEDEARKCGDELKILEKKAEEKKKVECFIGTLNEIRDAYGKDGIQKMIRARAKPLLERSTRDLFERFNLSYSDIKIDDDYNISVIGANGVKDIDQISGGERVALAIALRLAIAQVLSGKIETIIMDEPTTHLDEQRRKELVNVLSSFFREGGRIIPQMVIITHHPEIEDVADTTYLIRKEEDYSITEKATLN